MFSFSAYTTTLPFGNYMPYDADMVCAEFDKNQQLDYDQTAYTSTSHLQYPSNTTEANAEPPTIRGQNKQTDINSIQPTSFSGGSVELLDYETGEISRLVDKPLLCTKDSVDIDDINIAASDSSFDGDVIEKKKPIWMPPRDAETGQPLYPHNIRRSVAEIAARAALPVTSYPQSRLSTPVASENRSTLVDVDSLLNSFDVNHIDLTALDREVSLAELGSLLDPSAVNAKDKFDSQNYRLPAAAEPYHYQQPKQTASAAFDMAPEEYFSSPMLDTGDDIMMPSMTNNAQQCGSSKQQQVPERRVVPALGTPSSSNWPAAGHGNGGMGGGNGSGKDDAEDDGSGQRHNGSTDGAVFGCAADVGGFAVENDSTIGYYPAQFADPQQLQQHVSSTNQVDGGEIFGDEMSGWAPSSAFYAYDFGQESFVLPTTSQAWRYDLSYVGAYSPSPFAGYNDEQQQQPNFSEADMMMPVAEEKFDISSLGQQQQQPISSIEALLSSSSASLSYPLYAEDAGKKSIIPNTSGGFVMPIKAEAEPVVITAPARNGYRRLSKSKAGKHATPAVALLSESQLHVARSLEVASFRHADDAGESSRGSSPSMLSMNRTSRYGTSIGSVDSASMNKRILRDRKLVEQHKLPFSYDDIVWMPVDEFNNVLVSPTFALTLKQRDLLKDIRRRGKNKVAARNCRRRKVDQIDNLDETVRTMRDKQNRADEDLRRVDANLECALQVLAALRRQTQESVAAAAAAVPVAGF